MAALASRLGRVKRMGIITLDDGYKFEAEFTINQDELKHIKQLEQTLVREFNLSQPHMVHRIVNIHLMRK